MTTAAPKLSKASKMPCRSWSLEALVTCPAAKNSDGSLVDACKGCYATTGNYNYPNVKAPRQHNREDWKSPNWSEVMIKELDNDRYFRWFDSGDMYDLRLANKILEVMTNTPWVKHWLPTRMFKFSKFAEVIAQMESLPNVVVRKSSDSVVGGIVEGLTSSTIIPTVEEATEEMAVCLAYANSGKCGDCRKCWDKTIKVVAYPAHGAKMNKVIRLINV